MKNEIIIVADYSDEPELTLTDLCEICRVEAMLVEDLIDYDILLPKHAASGEMIFNMTQLKRLQTALRLQRDLEINHAGIALVLQLLEELEELRAAHEVYQKHLLK